MQAPDRFRINAPDVINQTIDDEAIVLHLGTGRYYSARGTGAHAWELLSQAVPVADVVARFASAYDASEAEISASLDTFIAYLTGESLIVPAEGAADPNGAQAAHAPEGGKVAFEAPAMESFSDLEDLLLLDPVHEVDAQQGWPHPEAQA